ncbi:caspase family protein [Prevotella communis]|uniref:caspase family protein n=1 Tax=Prevotella communis TaxID=2913614 RepID=UPI001EDA3093|nr:caspase family protein [Prevotella communis]UKK58654.1 caspase family protein [Prevotella communis]
MNRFLLLVITSVMLFFACKGYSQDFPDEGSVITETQSIRKKIHILAIGIGTYKKPLEDLLAAYQLNHYSSIAHDYIWPNYKKQDKHEKVEKILSTVSVNDVKNGLGNFLKIIDNENPKDVVVMIHILGHGEAVNNEYYLVCSNGEKISGTEIKEYLIEMANKGALVIVFLDTCHAGALFKDGDFSSINSKKNGAIAFYASSQAGQEADGFKKDEKKAPFTDIILRTLANENEEAYNSDTLTLYSLKHYVEERFEGKKQKPCVKLFPQNKDFKILLKAGKVKKFSIYTGILVGQPIVSAFGGLTLFKNCIVHGKIEAGVSILPQREANSVYLYKSDNRFSGGYNYISSFIQPFVRLGAEIDLGKDWSLIPLVGLSFLSISGDPIPDVGASDGKGEKATATCLSSNVRLAWAPFKMKNWQIHATAGYDVGIGDTNYNKLRENDDVKKMAEYLKGLRGQLGVVYNF